MNIVREIDLAIKLTETQSTDGAYTVTYNGQPLPKDTYMTNDEWIAFLDAMPQAARIEYGAGSGSELSEKNGRPPKMASYGSSSRLIYRLSRSNSDFHYEKKLPTTVGGKANLDGFYEDEKRYIFVESKCHEPYSRHQNVVSTCYVDLYEYINDRMGDNLQIAMEPCGKERQMEVDYWAEREWLQHFDIKQMICHLLGIATGLLKGTLEQKQIDFLYLLYDPTELALSDDAKKLIDFIYERTCYECNLIDFPRLFGVILDFLRETKYMGVLSDEQADALVAQFAFRMVSQNSYPPLIK